MTGWTESAQPVLEAGAAGAFDEQGVQGPSVLKAGKRGQVIHFG